MGRLPVEAELLRRCRGKARLERPDSTILSWLVAGRAPEATLAQVKPDIVFGHVSVAGIAVGRAGQAAWKLVQVHLLDRQGALQISLLIDREGHVRSVDISQ